MNYACDFDRSRTTDIRYGSPASAAALEKLREHGVNWIAITPFGFQRSEPNVRMGGYEDDASLRGATTQAQAHALGIRVMLKPHIWARDEAAMERWTDEEWRKWFASYEQFITHYATLARDAKIDALCIGNEQKHSTRYEREWRTIIQRVRQIYNGPLTYGANFDEVERVAFWDDLDWIGVSGAAWQQWKLPRTAPLNLEVQREAYEAFFEAVWPQPWLAGAYPWKWFSSLDHSGPTDNDYEIENKPAAEVVRRHYKAQ